MGRTRLSGCSSRAKRNPSPRGLLGWWGGGGATAVTSAGLARPFVRDLEIPTRPARNGSNLLPRWNTGVWAQARSSAQTGRNRPQIALIRTAARAGRHASLSAQQSGKPASRPASAHVPCDQEVDERPDADWEVATRCVSERGFQSPRLRASRGAFSEPTHLRVDLAKADDVGRGNPVGFAGFETTTNDLRHTFHPSEQCGL